MQIKDQSFGLIEDPNLLPYHLIIFLAAGGGEEDRGGEEDGGWEEDGEEYTRNQEDIIQGRMELLKLKKKLNHRCWDNHSGQMNTEKSYSHRTSTHKRL